MTTRQTTRELAVCAGAVALTAGLLVITLTQPPGPTITLTWDNPPAMNPGTVTEVWNSPRSVHLDTENECRNEPRNPAPGPAGGILQNPQPGHERPSE